MCHEMVHVWQGATRKMKDLTCGRKMYMGKVYDDTTAYSDEPWEIEAYAMQGGLGELSCIWYATWKRELLTRSILSLRALKVFLTGVHM